ncbi:fungal-specific transcription factor domain-containing protein [Suillus subalutaceus]|uniref:fungal-specific transcription factor domain-containing protein n=1 Tax=Suillus subalutaceus TaxID=48586 RepID=UPI001B861209|nr:fungal-specific transcription factor domain-containing protein [Suillus subalutaceus]KAG1870780.1 fungal-specific transcription factor domain-containing protein [Suillus subalutaceus]
MFFAFLTYPYAELMFEKLSLETNPLNESKLVWDALPHASLGHKHHAVFSFAVESPKYCSSSASGSPSPSSETPSNNTSPAHIPAPLRPSKASDETDSQSTHSRETPNRMPVDLPRGGHAACEERNAMNNEKGNSCHTCKRLRIDCLGWGTRRPEWMRDKKAVEDYKAGIKAQLTRAGLIRGQPKSSILQATSAGPSSTSSSVFASRRLQGSASSSGSSRVNDLGIPAYVDQLADSTGMSVFALPALFPHTHRPWRKCTFIPDFDTATQNLYDPPMTSIPDDGLQMEHIFYYFEHVRQLQYAFAGNSEANITYSLVLQHPQGPVANAISALASLHFSLIRIAHGFEAPNPNLEHSPAIRFYDSAHQQIYRNKQTTLSESDANAAIHMLSFSLMSGGVTDWRPMLDIASEWLVRTGITTSDNPKLMMINMNEASRLALKATITKLTRSTQWCDIMSTLALKTTPKHLTFYRRLFHRGSCYWGLAQQGIGDESALRMDSLTGCPDEVLLGIAEIATLSCWKTQELRKGSLSMRELIRRGDVIDHHLRTQTEAALSAEGDQTPLHPELLSMVAEHGNVQNSPPGHAGTSLPAGDTRRIVADIFREAAILYLHTVLSDPNPGVPEIVNSIDVIVQLLNQLPASNIDRCLVFPICLAGCLVDDPMKREFLTSRLQGQHDGFGNTSQTLRVMQTAWQKRDNQGGKVEWQDLLHIQGRYLLLLV